MWFFRHVADRVVENGREDFIAAANQAFRLTGLTLLLLALAAVDYVIRLAE
jgi:hypothetical protein